jgi:hypothetical protein
MVHWKGLALAAGLALSSTSAGAQTAASPRQLELAERLMVSMMLDKQMGQMAAQMQPMMAEQMRRANPTMTGDQAAILSEAFSASMPPLMAKVRTRIVPLYAATFSERELKDTIAFYESASGRALLEKTPELTAKMMPIMFELMPEMMIDVRERLCAKVDCSKMKLPPPPKA